MENFEERQYDQLRKLGQALGIPIIEAFLTLEVFDKDKKLIQRHHQRSHSWVRNAYNHMFTELGGKDADDVTFGAGLLSGKDTGGSIRSGSNPLGFGGLGGDAVGTGYRAGAGIDDFGILVGSGTNAEDFEQYALQTQIVDGAGSGQLSYIESAAHSTTYTAGTKTFKNELARYFNNNSGDTISVNEVAIVARLFEPIDTYYLHSRDKLASAVNIPDTGQLKVTYTIQLVYPA